MKILVAVDGSSFTKRMLAYLAAHDEWLGDRHRYTVLTVVQPIPARAAAVITREVLAGYYEDQAAKVFKPIRTFFQRQGLEASFVSQHGDAAAVISAQANKGKFDLLMLGSHGHSALGNLVLGSVATKVIAHTKAPVLVIR